MNQKIGAAVITYNREQYFDKCINSIPNPGMLIVVNDGTPYDNSIYPSTVDKVIQHENNLNVGISKNDAMKYLMEEGCEHIFLIEDDIKILRDDVYDTYIHAAEASGILHLNFRPKEVRMSGFIQPLSRMLIDYGNNNKIDLHYNLAGCFTYFHRSIIEEVGYHDERFFNAMEHVELTYRIIKNGMHPPFWWFADIHDSLEYISEINESSLKSSICNRKDHVKNFNDSMILFKEIHGVAPSHITPYDEDRVTDILKQIKTKYSVKSQ